MIDISFPPLETNTTEPGQLGSNPYVKIVPEATVTGSYITVGCALASVYAHFWMYIA